MRICQCAPLAGLTQVTLVSRAVAWSARLAVKTAILIIVPANRCADIMAFPAVCSLCPKVRPKLRQWRCDSLYLGRPKWVIFMQIAQLMGSCGKQQKRRFLK